MKKIHDSWQLLIAKHIKVGNGIIDSKSLTALLKQNKKGHKPLYFIDKTL